MCEYHAQDLSSGLLQYMGLIPIGLMALHERHKPPLSTSSINAVGNMVQGGILLTTPMMILGSGYMASALLWSLIMMQRYILNRSNNEPHFGEIVLIYRTANIFTERIVQFLRRQLT